MASNFGKLDKDLFCGTLWIKGNEIFDANSNLKNVNNLTVDGNALVYGDEHIVGNAIVGGWLTAKLNDQTGISVYQKIKNASVSIYNSTNQEFFSGFFVDPNGWVVSAAHGFLHGNVTTKESAANVFVSVTQVNGSPMDNLVIQASNIYVDAAGDIAVIKLPGIMTQSYLEWGNSLNTSPGNQCFAIGNPLASDQQSICEGIVRDNTFVKYPIAVESILTSVSSYSGNSGSPIVNQHGKVLGILTFGIQGDANADVSTLTGGPSQRIAQRVVDDMITMQHDYDQKGYLGVETWYPVNAFDIVQLGLLGSGFTTKGIRLGNVIPGDALDLAHLQTDDIITQCNGLVLGDLEGQTNITTVTWFKTAGETVDIQYIRPPSTTLIGTFATLDLYPESVDEPLFGNFAGSGDGVVYNLPGTRLRR